MDDRIRINGLQFYSSIFGSPWPTITASNRQHAELQPVVVSIEMHLDLQNAGHLDNLSHSVDYSQLSKKVRDACSLSDTGGLVSETPYGLAQRIMDFCLKDIKQPIRQFDVELEFPKLVLRAKSAGVKLSWSGDDDIPMRHTFFVSELPIHTIVGLRQHERMDKQPVIISLRLEQANTRNKSIYFDYSGLERRISDFVEASSYLTIEALTVHIAKECLVWLDDPASFTVSVTLAKPAAISTAQAPEIRVTRSLSDFPSLKTKSTSKSGNVFAALALGANLGDRFQNIELALRYLEDIGTLTLSIPDLPPEELRVVDTSFLYESAPMYVESQPAFINCACLVETTLSPYDLLRVCKHIETIVGRVPSERFGPRAVDLDIITYGDKIFDTRATELSDLEGELVIPHPRMAEREFVLRPLKDGIIPEWVHPRLHLSIRALLAKAIVNQPSTLERVIPFPFSPNLRPPGEHKTPATQTYWILPNTNTNATSTSERARLERRYTMATLNVTPDSFSDGGEHNTLNSALEYARSAVAAGADIIDIGGCSTRPGAVEIPPEEEIARVVPVIRAIRSDTDERLRGIPISIDTFRVEVAQTALDAGANCINDVYAFSGGAEYYFPPSSSPPSESLLEESEKHFAAMQALARERGVPVILMHSRGYADKNKDYSQYTLTGLDPSHPSHNVIEGVRFELSAKVLKALKGPAGLRRWQVIVDPGIGFSKDVNGNLQVLRKAGEIVRDGFLPPGTSDFYANKKEEERMYESSPYATPNWNPLAGFPMLVGASRKSFLWSLMATPFLPSNKDSDSQSPVEEGQEQEQGNGNGKSRGKDRPRPAKERDFATAAAVACAIQQGAAIVRVHAVKDMVDVVKVAAAIWSRE